MYTMEAEKCTFLLRKMVRSATIADNRLIGDDRRGLIALVMITIIT